mgnify:FL=1
MAYTAHMNSIFRPSLSPTVCRLPLFGDSIPAGFPSPAADYIESSIDLNELLVRDPLATFFLRVQGESMQDSGIRDGSVVVVEAGLTAVPGDIVVAELNGSFTLKRLRKVAGRYELHPDNPDFPVIRISEGSELRIFGVVTATVHQFRK